MHITKLRSLLCAQVLVSLVYAAPQLLLVRLHLSVGVSAGAKTENPLIIHKFNFREKRIMVNFNSNYISFTFDLEI